MFYNVLKWMYGYMVSAFRLHKVNGIPSNGRTELYVTLLLKFENKRKWKENKSSFLSFDDSEIRCFLSKNHLWK